MKRVPARAALLVLAAALSWSLYFGGCGRDHRNSQAPRNASDRGQNPALPSAGDCYNPFFPAVPDETLEYESTFKNDLLPVYSYSVTFIDISDGTFTQHQEVTGGTAPASYGSALDRIWKCQSDGLASVEYADLCRPESRLKFETLDAAGVAIPRPDRWQKGAKWTYRYSVRGKMSFGEAPTPVDVEGTVSVAAEIVSQERVDVPAGIYEAVKVQSTYNEGLTMKGKAPMPINITFTVLSWYARDIGMIKSASEDLRVTTVLKSLTK
jgi:hypothetical protein